MEPAEVDTRAAAPVVEVVFPYNVVVVAPGEYNVVVGVQTYWEAKVLLDF